MQPTLFTTTCAAARAAEMPQSLRGTARIRFPRKVTAAAAAAVAALALGSGLMTAGDAPGSSTGPTRHSDFRSAIVTPKHLLAHCPHTGPAPR